MVFQARWRDVRRQNKPGGTSGIVFPTLTEYMIVCEYTQVKSFRPPPGDRMVESITRRFRVLGDPLRLRILWVLENGERSVNGVAEELGANQSNVSRHLRILDDSGILSNRRAGNQVFYSIADPVIFKLCDLVCRGTATDVHRRLAAIPASFVDRRRK